MSDIHKVLTTKTEKKYYSLSQSKGNTILCGEHEYISASSEDQFVDCKDCLGLIKAYTSA